MTVGKIEFEESTAADKRPLSDLIGCVVEVRTNGADNHHLDKGVLLGFEDPWVKIESNGDILCFPVHNIRLLKMAKRSEPLKPSNTLLRPSG